MLIVARSEIEAAIETRSLGADIEAAYVAMSAGGIELPPVGQITFPHVRGDCHIKFGHRRGDDDFVINIATGFPTHQASTNSTRSSSARRTSSSPTAPRSLSITANSP